MSDVKRWILRNGKEHHEYVLAVDYDAMCDALRAERDQINAERENARDWLVEHCALQAERDQLRAEMEAIRGQQPVAWVSPDAVGGTRWKAGALQQLNDGSPLYALPPQQPDAVSVPREVLDVGQLIRTQDNRCTDAPLFAVMKKQAIVTSPDHDYDYIEWVNVEDDYAVASDTKARRLEALYDGCRDVPEGWERFAMKEIDVFVTACFTEQGCKDFLARDGHNHRKPFIYAFGSHRNAEFRAIREWLAALPATKTTP